MSRGAVAFLLMAVVTVAALIAAFYHELVGGWIIPTRLEHDDLNLIARWTSALAALLTVIVVTGTATAAWYQLSHVRESGQLNTTLTILSRYIEDRQLFKARDFIHQHMDEVNLILKRIVIASQKQEHGRGAAFANEKRREIEKEIRRVREAGDTIELLDIYLVINTLNNASWLMREKLVPVQLSYDLVGPVSGAYEKLRPLLEYEWIRRGQLEPEHRHLYYAHHFVKLSLGDPKAVPGVSGMTSREGGAAAVPQSKCSRTGRGDGPERAGLEVRLGNGAGETARLVRLAIGGTVVVVGLWIVVQFALYASRVRQRPRTK